jgi:hypothetical protein
MRGTAAIFNILGLKYNLISKVGMGNQALTFFHGFSFFVLKLEPFSIAQFESFTLMEIRRIAKSSFVTSR